MKSFRIDVYRTRDAFSACAFGVQGNWSRGLNSALEDLLNKMLQAGIEHLEVLMHEPPEKTPFDVEGTSPTRSIPIGTNETETDSETGQDEFKP